MLRGVRLLEMAGLYEFGLGLLSQTPAAASVRSSRAAGDGCIMDFGLDTLQLR